MKSGHFTTNKAVIKDNLDVEDIKKFNIIRTFQNMTKLTSYVPGTDGRVRTSFNMFGTVTGEQHHLQQNILLVQVSGLEILLNQVTEII